MVENLQKIVAIKISCGIDMIVVDCDWESAAAITQSKIYFKSKKKKLVL